MKINWGGGRGDFKFPAFVFAYNRSKDVISSRNAHLTGEVSYNLDSVYQLFHGTQLIFSRK